MVRIAECRPISKTKKFIVIEKMEAKKWDQLR
jgi:ribosomal protein S17